MKDKREEEGGINYSFPYMREVDTHTRWENCCLFLYNPDEHTFLGRTSSSWARIIFFYLVFYSGLAALFSICLKGMMSTISLNEPKYKLKDSLIGTNPGLGFRPLSDRTEESGLIYFDSKNYTQIEKYVNLLNDFLDMYLTTGKLPNGGRNHVQCDYGKPAPPGKVCIVDVRNWEPCTPNLNYSYNHGSPCIFLKLNKIYGWQPEFYDDPNDLPEDMPENLKEHITNLPPDHRKQVWISCDGDNPVDKEQLQGGIKYVPQHGLPEYYFPYVNTPGYMSPLIAVQILRPSLNRLINIECRAWAKNIIYVGSERDRRGSVHFELMID